MAGRVVALAPEPVVHKIPGRLGQGGAISDRGFEPGFLGRIPAKAPEPSVGADAVQQHLSVHDLVEPRVLRIAADVLRMQKLALHTGEATRKRPGHGWMGPYALRSDPTYQAPSAMRATSASYQRVPLTTQSGSK